MSDRRSKKDARVAASSAIAKAISSGTARRDAAAAAVTATIHAADAASDAREAEAQEAVVATTGGHTAGAQAMKVVQDPLTAEIEENATTETTEEEEGGEA